MDVFKDVGSLQGYLKPKIAENRTVGFVPTMGALHRGHASLIKRSISENDITVCSVFVNSLQFNNENDLKNYPRNIEKDIAFLSEIDCDVLFAPSHEGIYPSIPKENYDFGQLDQLMEGAFRPGHFKGVAIVVGRFFEIVSPTRAYFGMKDYQQLVIIKDLVRQKDLKVEIVACETERDANGLALSSRNELLTVENREKAANIYGWLMEVKNAKGKIPIETLKDDLSRRISNEEGFRLEYLEIANPENLSPLDKWEESKEYICCTAIYLGDVRLIDNILF